MKKLISLLLALILVLSMATVAFAAGNVTDPENPGSDITDPDDTETEETTPVSDPKHTPITDTITNNESRTDGTISITGLHRDPDGDMDSKYVAYKILHLESYNEASDAYSYVVIDGWMDFFTNGDGREYANFNAQGYLVWIADDDEETATDFAKDALAYATANGINPVRSSETEGDMTINEENVGTFSNLSLGYYLVDSNVGALCGLTTTAPNGVINAKNGAPSLIKKVQENSAVGSETNSWFDENSASIGDYVQYDVTITVHAGAQNYVFHDRMDNGLAFVVDVNGVETHGLHKVRRLVLETGVTTDLTAGTDYTLVTTGITDGCDFHIVFSDEFCEDLETGDNLYITYQALLDGHADIGSEVGTDGNAANVNKAWLTYGETHTSVVDTAITYTYRFDLIKTDAHNRLIDGAQFKIYDQATGGEPIMIVKKADGTYRKATKVLSDLGETNVANTITVTNGKATIEGLDSGVYYLEEISAPAGYNKLEYRVRFVIDDKNLDASFVNNAYSSGTGVQVKNSTGKDLPTTGAMGTAMFITFGMIVVIGTGVLLVTKKRMSMIQE